MLQDLAFGQFNNQFKTPTISDNDVTLLFFGGKVLIHRDKNDALTLPKFCETNKSPEMFRYAFNMQSVNYFLYFGDEFSLENYEAEPVRGLRQIISKEVCFAIMSAWHIYCWYVHNAHCGRCGGKTVHDEKERMLRCPDCGNMIYPRISPAVIIAVTNGDKLLLSKYAGRSYTRFALLAGYTEFGETLEETVKREVMEEVGLKVKNIRYYKSQPWGVDGNILMGFYCDLDGDDTICIDENELSMASWYKRGEIPAKDDGISLTREMIRVFDEGKFR